MAYGITEYPNMFKRQDSFPLDSSSIYLTMEEAIQYINKSNTTAYAGQIISVKTINGFEVYIVQKINDGFKLVNLNSLNYTVGAYSLYERIPSVSVEFSFDIHYPIKAKYYNVCLNETIIEDSNGNTLFEIGNSFITTPIIFDEDNILSVKLVNEQHEEIIELYSKKVFENDKIKLGILSLSK